jgi:hypothetical protein
MTASRGEAPHPRRDPAEAANVAKLPELLRQQDERAHLGPFD